MLARLAITLAVMWVTSWLTIQSSIFLRSPWAPSQSFKSLGSWVARVTASAMAVVMLVWSPERILKMSVTVLATPVAS